MASKHNNGLAKTLAAFDRLKDQPRAALMASLQKSAEELAAAQRALAPEDTGALKDSIVVTPAGQATPAYSQPGGSMVVPPNSVAVTVGNSEVRYPHLVQYGTATTEAIDFFWRGWRFMRDRITRRTRRDVKKAAKMSWEG